MCDLLRGGVSKLLSLLIRACAWVLEFFFVGEAWLGTSANTFRVVLKSRCLWDGNLAGVSSLESTLMWFGSKYMPNIFLERSQITPPDLGVYHGGRAVATAVPVILRQQHTLGPLDLAIQHTSSLPAAVHIAIPSLRYKV